VYEVRWVWLERDFPSRATQGGKMSEELPADKKVILDALGQSVAEKRERLAGLGMMNVHGVDEVTRARMSMVYAQAQSDLWNAERDLAAAIRKGETP
jgi:hypothetical protein